MIGFSAWATGLFWSVKDFFVAIEGHPSIAEPDRVQAVANIELWAIIVPVAIACIGANLITAWILQPKAADGEG